ncbi:DUF7573 domain-containing protein [Halobacterium zhouii]|uniref:DUF7573 domain-containing protein n=1 Tax=Halobacterium zhouii TaxID=2902624 RepID=UPI001E479F11|nr:hypothetical protein [Halobacterium zhouii]
MTEDATLDAFADTDESGAESEETADASEGGEESPASGEGSRVAREESADDAPAPSTLTSSWRPGGECAACGSHAARRWRDGDEHVCRECASWSV